MPVFPAKRARENPECQREDVGRNCIGHSLRISPDSSRTKRPSIALAVSRLQRPRSLPGEHVVRYQGVKFDERALGGTSDESGEADGEKARGTQMGLPRVCTVRERAGMVVGLSSYG